MQKKAGIRISHFYLDDNGRFANNAFLDIKSQDVTITYCGVNAHQPNIRAEANRRFAVKNKRFVARCYPPMAGRYNTPIWPYNPTMAKK